jgi:hypothetical protein
MFFLIMKKIIHGFFFKKHNVWPYTIGLFDINGEMEKKYIDNFFFWASNIQE